MPCFSAARSGAPARLGAGRSPIPPIGDGGSSPIPLGFGGGRRSRSGRGGGRDTCPLGRCPVGSFDLGAGRSEIGAGTFTAGEVRPDLGAGRSEIPASASAPGPLIASALSRAGEVGCDVEGSFDAPPGFGVGSSAAPANAESGGMKSSSAPEPGRPLPAPGVPSRVPVRGITSSGLAPAPGASLAPRLGGAGTGAPGTTACCVIDGRPTRDLQLAHVTNFAPGWISSSETRLTFPHVVQVASIIPPIITRRTGPARRSLPAP